jgi:hypothetical protein
MSLIAGLLMGTGAFIYATNFAQYGLRANGIIGPGTLICVLLLRLGMAIVFRVKSGSWIGKEKSNVRN